MRFFLKFLFVCTVSTVFAQEDIRPRHELYFGVNLTRLIADDYELQIFYRVSNRSIIGISGGYDFNKRAEEFFTDTKVAVDTTGWHAIHVSTRDFETNETSRYFFGKGAAFRLWYEWLHRNKKREKFVTAELVLKFRDYNNYYYQQLNTRFLESASQKIYGLSVYSGRYLKIQKFILLKYFWGLGVRYLHSQVTRPGYIYNNQWVPEEKFLFQTGLLSIHLGLTFVINTAGTGVPEIVW